MRKFFSALVVFAFTAPAWAVGTFISAPQRVDMVHDSKRNVIYISEADHVLRYDVTSGAMLPSIVLEGSSLGGLDISPDNEKLVVADRNGVDTASWVYVVDLDNLSHQRYAAGAHSTEGGMFTAVYGADNNIYTTSTYNGSGNVPLRRLNPATFTWTELATVRQNTMLSASGDGNTIAFAESNSSGGMWGLIDIPTGSIVRRSSYSDATGWYNYEIATDRFGAQFSIPVYGGTFVYDDVYQKVATLGQYAGPQPIGAAYHPVERVAYFPWAQTQEVKVYDMNTFTQIGSHNFEFTFTSNGNHAFQNGRAKLSRDGSILMATVGNGVRFTNLYSPLSAANVSASTVGGVPVAIPLAGSVGNGGIIEYSLVSGPANGNVTISGNTATYTSTTNFVGNVTFAYRATYGRETRDATVSVAVASSNRAPVAVNDFASATAQPISIYVLANDTDPDGDAFSLVSVTQPSAGQASIVGNRIVFTPPKKFTGAVFTYTIRDSRGASDTAVVTVSKR